MNLIKAIVLVLISLLLIYSFTAIIYIIYIALFTVAVATVIYGVKKLLDISKKS